jgi:uncharacterized protein YjdB
MFMLATVGVACEDRLKDEPKDVAVTGVAVSPDSYTLTVGDPPLTLTADVLPKNATNKALTWLSDHPEIASVKDGVVTAIKEGAAKITAKTVDGELEAHCEITVDPDVTPLTDIGLEEDEEQMTLGGETLTLTPVFTPADATNKALTWESNHPEIASVKDGVVTAVSEGTAVITATSVEGNHEASCTVHVVVPVTGLNCLLKTVQTVIDEPFVLDGKFQVIPENATNQTIIYTSADPAKVSIAKNDVDGKHYATAHIASGEVVITATTEEGGYEAKMTVEVIDIAVHPTSVSLDRESITLMFPDGRSKTLTAEVLPTDSNNKDLTWESSNNGVVTVEDGVLTPTGEGTATITVKTVDGLKTDECAVAVTYLGEVTFMTDQTWTPEANRRIFSDDVLVERCRGDVAFNAGSVSPVADCRENATDGEGNPLYGDIMSFQFVMNHKDQLCPAPWQVPTGGAAGDFFALDRSTGGTGQSQGGRASVWEEMLGIRYGGMVNPGSSALSGQGSRSAYWSSTPTGQRNVYIMEAGKDTGTVNPQATAVNGAFCGFALRCVNLNIPN